MHIKKDASFGHGDAVVFFGSMGITWCEGRTIIMAVSADVIEQLQHRLSELLRKSLPAWPH